MILPRHFQKYKNTIQNESKTAGINSKPNFSRQLKEKLSICGFLLLLFIASLFSFESVQKMTQSNQIIAHYFQTS